MQKQNPTTSPFPFLLIALILLLTSCATPSDRTATSNSKPRIIRIHGLAETSHDGGKTWKKATLSSDLPPGAVLRTSTNSRIDLALSSPNSFLRLAETTEATLGRDRVDGSIFDTEIKLHSGRILASVSKMEAGSKFLVRMGEIGSAGVRSPGPKQNENAKIEFTATGEVTVLTGLAIAIYVVESGWLDCGQAIVSPGYISKRVRCTESFLSLAPHSDLVRLRTEFDNLENNLLQLRP